MLICGQYSRCIHLVSGRSDVDDDNDDDDDVDNDDDHDDDHDDNNDNMMMIMENIKLCMSPIISILYSNYHFLFFIYFH